MIPNRAISYRNYENALNVWKAFKMNAMKDYRYLYLKTDVLLLTCVFEIFRKESINQILLIFYLLLAIVGTQCYGLQMLF